MVNRAMDTIDGVELNAASYCICLGVEEDIGAIRKKRQRAPPRRRTTADEGAASPNVWDAIVVSPAAR